MEKMLTIWTKHLNELRSQHDWLLFFSMPKLLLLYHLIRKEAPNLEAIVHEISFLCSNEQAAWKSTHELVKVSNGWRMKGGRKGKEGREKSRDDL